VSRKSVPKRKTEIPLDELLGAHAAGDDRLQTLMGRYSGSVVPASTLGAKSAKGPNPIKKGSKKAPGARFVRLDDSQVIPIAEPRLIGYARVSTDEQTTALQLDALRTAGCVPIHEDSTSGASRSRPGLTRALEDLPPAILSSFGGSTASDAHCATCSIFPKCYGTATSHCDR